MDTLQNALQRIFDLERRVAELEDLKHNRTIGTQLSIAVGDAITGCCNQLTGDMTASDVAALAGLQPDQATLIQIGRYFDGKGVERVRSGGARLFRFSVSNLGDAISAHTEELKGDMSASEVAKLVGLPTDQSMLIQIGKYFDSKGVERIRTSRGRLFRFGGLPDSGPKPRKEMPLSDWVAWFDSALSSSGGELVGAMTVRQIARLMKLPVEPHIIERITAAMTGKGVTAMTDTPETQYIFSQ